MLLNRIINCMIIKKENTPAAAASIARIFTSGAMAHSTSQPKRPSAIRITAETKTLFFKRYSPAFRSSNSTRSRTRRYAAR